MGKLAKATTSLGRKEFLRKEVCLRSDENIDRWCKDNSVHDLDFDAMSYVT